MAIRFYNEDVRYKLLNKQLLKSWLKQTAINNGNKFIGDLTYVFCSDEHLLSINKEYLKHDYYTDIITFDLSEDEGILEGEMYISIDRVKDNAASISKSNFEQELYRVMVHGLLHLTGLGDKSEAEINVMRNAEDLALENLKTLLTKQI
jgi:probable rRNA maturation factor